MLSRYLTSDVCHNVTTPIGYNLNNFLKPLSSNQVETKLYHTILSSTMSRKEKRKRRSAEARNRSSTNLDTKKHSPEEDSSHIDSIASPKLTSKV